MDMGIMKYFCYGENVMMQRRLYQIVIFLEIVEDNLLCFTILPPLHGYVYTPTQP